MFLRSGENATDLRIIVDMSLWVVHNPAPATYILVSGDKFLLSHGSDSVNLGTIL